MIWAGAWMSISVPRSEEIVINKATRSRNISESTMDAKPFPIFCGEDGKTYPWYSVEKMDGKTW